MLQFLSIAILLILGCVWPASVSAVNQILNVRHWVAPDHTRVVIDTSEDVPFTVDQDGRKICVDLSDSVVSPEIPSLFELKKPGIEKVALHRIGDSGVRIELTTPDHVQIRAFKLNKIQDKPVRIVIDIVLPDVARQQSQERELVKTARKNRIIVIDPGHGGEAVGAIGIGGTREKDVALSISKKLREILNSRSGYNAFLTRDGDYYVSFGKRLMIAREYGADVFVSIHADAARNRTAGGSSVYCFSSGGASSEAAKILARNENLADVIGGVPNTEGTDASDPVILDMFQTHAINQSRTFGGALLQYLGAVNHLKFGTVQEAQFLVLKLPDIPSVLIETAYISNPKEEKLLRSSPFQTRIAKSVAQSVIEFLPPLPAVSVRRVGDGADGKTSQNATGDGPRAGRSGQMAEVHSRPDKLPAIEPVSAGRAVKDMTSHHIVKKGDTLYSIARTHGVTVDALIRLNRMNAHDSLAVNRILKITDKPSTVTGEKEQKGYGNHSPASKSKRAIYRIKKGDTLTAIARMHGTSVSALVDLNHLKPSDPLFVGRPLFVPE